MGKFGEAGIERDEQLNPARDFEKRPVFSEDWLCASENFRRGMDGSGNVDFPSLVRIVVGRASGKEPLALCQRQRMDQPSPFALELFERSRAEPEQIGDVFSRSRERNVNAEKAGLYCFFGLKPFFPTRE